MYCTIEKQFTSIYCKNNALQWTVLHYTELHCTASQSAKLYFIVLFCWLGAAVDLGNVSDHGISFNVIIMPECTAGFATLLQ